MHVDEVISHLNHRPHDAFLGVKYEPKKQYVEIYLIYIDTDNDNLICIDYEAGFLFSSDSEEGSFSIEEMKQEITYLKFNQIDKNSWDTGLSAEYAMHNLFPNDLQDPEEIFTQYEKDKFSNRLD